MRTTIRLIAVATATSLLCGCEYFFGSSQPAPAPAAPAKAPPPPPPQPVEPPSVVIIEEAAPKPEDTPEETPKEPKIGEGEDFLVTAALATLDKDGVDLEIVYRVENRPEQVDYHCELRDKLDRTKRYKPTTANQPNESTELYGFQTRLRKDVGILTAPFAFRLLRIDRRGVEPEILPVTAWIPFPTRTR